MTAAVGDSGFALQCGSSPFPPHHGAVLKCLCGTVVMRGKHYRQPSTRLRGYTLQEMQQTNLGLQGLSTPTGL